MPTICLFILVETYVRCVLNRPLATLRPQRITTPVALGSSSSSTIWRTESSEGKASCFSESSRLAARFILYLSVFVPLSYLYHVGTHTEASHVPLCVSCRAVIEKYLLEKCRVVSRDQRERYKKDYFLFTFKIWA